MFVVIEEDEARSLILEILLKPISNSGVCFIDSSISHYRCCFSDTPRLRYVFIVLVQHKISRKGIFVREE